jgi:protease I
MMLNGMKVAILAADGFEQVEQVELVEPRNALDEAGAETFILRAPDRGAAAASML